MMRLCTPQSSLRRLSGAASARPRRRIPPQQLQGSIGSLSSCRILSTSAPPKTERELQAALARAEKEERRRLHEEKFEKAQAAKEEKRRQNELSRAQAQARRERHLQAQLSATQRKILAKRKNVIRSIPFWLGNEEGYFDMTMQALNLKSVVTTTTTTSTDGIAAEYRQLYLHSIPSFYQFLSEEQLFMTDELDALVEAGLDDLKFAKSFRQRLSSQVHLDRLDARLEKSKVLRDKQEAKLKVFQDRLEKIRQEESAIQVNREAEAGDESQATDNDDSTGLLGRALNAASSLFGTTSTPTEKDRIPVDKKSRAPRKSLRLKRQEGAVLDVEKQLYRIQRNLKLLQDERNSYKFDISEQDYEKAKEVVDSVMVKMCRELASHIHEQHSDTISQYQILDSKTDLTKPHEWYPHARLDRRKIIFHAGATNSGKTYTALERLKTAERGLYLGPLRLLAAEIYETLTSQGVYTNLFTGQEKREIPFATHAAATVEMAPTVDEFDVVVIDEIQMISDPYRGHAWTKALLGIRCKEIHVCGGYEARHIVQKIADFCGDELETITYERFSPLHVEEKSLAEHPKALGSYKTVQPGDCVVAFSRNDIFAIQREIEQSTDMKCCVIYGSLPPETRTDQARRFNDPDSGYDILVASDAIGMGLNLNIRRIIFNSLFKFTGDSVVRLDHSSVKQISGRAGRRNSQFPDGLVTCRNPDDMEYLRHCMSNDIALIDKAGLLPTAEHIDLFNEALKTYELGNNHDNLYSILVQFQELATIKGDFFLCRQTPMQIVAKLLNDVDLPLSDKYMLCMAPVNTSCSKAMTTIKQFAIKQSLQQASGVPRALLRPASSFDHLSNLCSIHNQLELFLWLTNKFPGSNVMEQQSALAMKESAITLINKGLGQSERLALNHCYIKRDLALRSEWKGKKSRKKKSKIDELDDYLPHSEVDEI